MCVFLTMNHENMYLLEEIAGKCTGRKAKFSGHVSLERLKKEVEFGTGRGESNDKKHYVPVPTSVIVCAPDESKLVVPRGFAYDINIANFAGCEDSDVELDDKDTETTIITQRDRICRRLDFACLLKPAGSLGLYAVNIDPDPLHRFFIRNGEGNYVAVHQNKGSNFEHRKELIRPDEELIFENYVLGEPQYALRLVTDEMLPRYKKGIVTKKPTKGLVSMIGRAVGAGIDAVCAPFKKSVYGR